MQQKLRRPDPPAREKTPGDIEREAIYARYDKAHPKAQPEIEDPDDPRYYMDQEEIGEFEREKLKADEGKTSLDRRNETLGKIYAKHSPAPEPEEEPNPWDDRPASQRGVEKFLEANPEFRQKGNWQELAAEAEKSFHDDLILLRKKAYESESEADVEKWLSRTAEILPGKKAIADRRAAFEEMAKRRMTQRGL